MLNCSMKNNAKNFLAVMLFVATVIMTGCASTPKHANNNATIPSGPYHSEFDGFEVMVCFTHHAAWPEQFELSITPDLKGKIENIEYSGGSADRGTKFDYEYKVESQGRTPFPEPTPWLEFAKSVISHPVTVAKKATYLGHYTYLGRHISPENTGYRFQKLGSEDVLFVGDSNWIGAHPKAGERLLLMASDPNRTRVFLTWKFGQGYVASLGG